MVSFSEFSKAVQALKLDSEAFGVTAHHSNGSGRDWEALQRQLREQQTKPERDNGSLTEKK